MERMGSRRAGQENGDGTSAGRAGVGRVTAASVAVTVAAVTALAGCSVTVQPKNAAASRPLSSSPTPSAAATSPSAPSPSASSSSAAPTPTPSDVDHAACGNVRDALETLSQKLQTDKDSASRSAQDYRNAGYALRTQGNKTKNSDLKAALKTIAADYLTVGYDAANHDSTDADLGKVAEASKPLGTLCGGGSGSSSGSTSSSGGSTGSSSGGASTSASSSSSSNG